MINAITAKRPQSLSEVWREVRVTGLRMHGNKLASTAGFRFIL